MLRRYTLPLLVLLMMTSAGSASAAAEANPVMFIRDLGSQALDVLATKAPVGERRARFRHLFEANFDTRGIARFVLGRYWRAATSAQKQQFLTLFEDYVVTAYAARLSDYSGETFRVLGDRPETGGFMVTSEIISPNSNQPLKLDWQLVNDKGSLKIADVVVEGVSMAVTQRSEFASVIARNGGNITGLLALLREKTESAQR